MVRIKNGTDKARINTINLIFGNRVGIKHEQIAHATNSDRGTKGISKALNQHEHAWEMHECDKIGKSAIGDVIRTRKKVQHFFIIFTI